MSRILSNRIIDAKPVFSSDSKFLAYANNTSIQIYDIQQKQDSHLLQGHSSKVTCLFQGPESALYSASLGGQIRQWNMQTGKLLRLWKLPFPVQQLIVLSEKFYILSGITRGKVFELLMEKKEPKRLFEHKNISAISYKDGSLVCAMKREILIWNTENSIEEAFVVCHNEIVTVLKHHPTRPALLVGDAKGRIFLWFCLDRLVQGSSATKELFHWHSHKVNDLSISADGKYMLSGGMEAVLVLWQIETGIKSFIPRLGADILTVGMNEKEDFYFAGCADNSIRIVKATSMKVFSIIRDLTVCSIGSFSVGIVSNPASGNIFLNGPVGFIQEFDLETQSVVNNYEICSQNPVSKAQSTSRNLKYFQVKKIAFSVDGEWMSTVEIRIPNSKEESIEMFLKFWRLEKDNFVLNSVIKNPHVGQITGLAFQPCENPLVVTSSEDGGFKLWELDEYWQCKSAGKYLEVACSSASFSGDGSVLSLVFGNRITLWNPFTNSILKTLFESEDVRFAHFIGKTPFLATFSRSMLRVWNLVSYTVKWEMQVRVIGFSLPTYTDSFAVSYQQKDDYFISVFGTDSNVPLHNYACDQVKRLLLTENNSIVALTQDRKLLEFNANKTVKQQKSHSKSEKLKYSSLFSHTKNMTPVHYESDKRKKLPEIPTQMIPSLSIYFDNIIPRK